MMNKLIQFFNKFLFLILLFLILFIQYYCKKIEIKQKNKYYSEMFLAAEKMKNLIEEIKKEKLKRGFEIDKNIDKNLTGIIGVEYSDISTTLGDLVAKRTSTNPDFAALIVKKIKELGVSAGDKIAVNMSSSFPALNLAVISALDVLNLDGIIVNTVGASSYGANIPKFTYLDMENFLYKKNLIKNKSIAYSLGGVDDVGKEFETKIIEYIKQKNKNYDLIFFYNPNLKNNIDERYNFYKNYGEIKLFINIGGNILSFGNSYSEIDNTNLVLSKNLKIKDGLIGKFYNAKIPVIHLLNIKGIAIKNKISIDDYNPKEIGTSPLFFSDEKENIFNALILFLVIFFIFYDKKIIKNFSEEIE